MKSALKRNTEEAQALGIFGAPSLTTEDGELFWGDDRLDQAIGWALNRAAKARQDVHETCDVDFLSLDIYGHGKSVLHCINSINIKKACKAAICRVSARPR